MGAAHKRIRRRADEPGGSPVRLVRTFSRSRRRWWTSEVDATCIIQIGQRSDEFVQVTLCAVGRSRNTVDPDLDDANFCSILLCVSGYDDDLLSRIRKPLWPLSSVFDGSSTAEGSRPWIYVKRGRTFAIHRSWNDVLEPEDHTR